MVYEQPGKPAVYKLCITPETPRGAREVEDLEPRALCAEPRAENAGTPRAARAKPVITIKQPSIDATTKLETALLDVFIANRPTTPRPQPEPNTTTRLAAIAATAANPTEAIETLPAVLHWALNDPFWSRGITSLETFARLYPKISASRPHTMTEPQDADLPNCGLCDNRRVIHQETSNGFTVNPCDCTEMSYA